MIEFKVDDQLSKEFEFESCLLLVDIFRYSFSDKLNDLVIDFFNSNLLCAL